jgi:DNA repair photolyase
MRYGRYKTILSSKNVFNLYRGCEHGCVYCDTRSECYEINHDLDDVEVKEDAEKILENELLRKHKRAMLTGGSMCDPYTPLEKELELTRKCLKIIEKHGFGVSLITKSNLVLRDLDILESIHKNAKCVIQITLTTFDEDLCRKLEPNVSTTKERAKTLEEFQKTSIPRVVWLTPILPYINDDVENLKGILDYCVKTEVKGIILFSFGMTLRRGSRDYYYKSLDKLFPGLKERYIREFGNNYEIKSPNHDFLIKIFNETCEKYNIIHYPQEVFDYIKNFEAIGTRPLF